MILWLIPRLRLIRTRQSSQSPGPAASFRAVRAGSLEALMADNRPHYAFTASRVCLFVAFVFFLLAAFGVKPWPVDMIAAGLALVAASGLVP